MSEKNEDKKPREKPVSLTPLNLKEALEGLLKVKPKPKDKKKRTRKQRSPAIRLDFYFP